MKECNTIVVTSGVAIGTSVGTYVPSNERAKVDPFYPVWEHLDNNQQPKNKKRFIFYKNGQWKIGNYNNLKKGSGFWSSMITRKLYFPFFDREQCCSPRKMKIVVDDTSIKNYKFEVIFKLKFQVRIYFTS